MANVQRGSIVFELMEILSYNDGINKDLNYNNGVFMAILWCLFSAIFAQSPLELGGTYSFNQSIEKMQARRIVPVYAFTQRGRNELVELKAQGYQCKALPRQTYRCVLFDKSIPATPAVKRRSHDYFSSSDLFISDSSVRPEILSEGESLIVYRFNKTVELKGIEFPYYDYQISISPQGEFHKIKVGEGYRREEFIVKSPYKLEKVYLTASQERDFFEQFLMKGDFVR